MTRSHSLFWFVGVLAVAGSFVLLAGSSLPPVVAAHFARGGSANGFMSRGAYLTLMLGLVVFLPLLLVLLHSLLRHVPPRFINLPNREYWLAPERSAETLAFLQQQGAYLATLFAAFLCLVHWLVVRANGEQPPHLPEDLFAIGLALFLVTLAVWLGAFVVHFRRSP